jgi:hypothetical protein
VLRISVNGAREEKIILVRRAPISLQSSRAFIDMLAMTQLGEYLSRRTSATIPTDSFPFTVERA